MYWAAILSVFAPATSQVELRAPMGTYVLHHRRDAHAELFDPTGLPVTSWAGVSWQEAKDAARVWLDDEALALGHRSPHADRHTVQPHVLA